MKRVTLKLLSAALCLTLLAGCSKDSKKASKSSNSDEDVEITNTVDDDKETKDTKDNDNSDSADTSTTSDENSDSNSGSNSGEPSLSPLAYDNPIANSGANVAVLSDSNATNINTSGISYLDVFGVGVKEDSIESFDTSIQINLVYFSSNTDGNDKITVYTNFTTPVFDNDSEIFMNLYIVDLATGEILSNLEDGYKIYDQIDEGTYEYELSATVPAGYRDLGLLVCDASTLPLSEAQLNCKDVVDYTNAAEITDGNQTLYVFDMNVFASNNNYTFWPSDSM